MTTILSVRKNNVVVMGGDGQATFGNVIIKNNVNKIRRIYKNKVIVGFAGSTADSFTFLDYFEKKLDYYHGNVIKSSLELAKDWRTDKILRRLQSMMAVVDSKYSLVITGNGDVIQPDDGILYIGSGGAYAFSSAKALYENTDMKAKDIVLKSLSIASNLCIYTNNVYVLEEIFY